MNPHILVLQFRTDVSEAHEQTCLQEEIGSIAKLTFVNAITQPLPPPTDFDGIILGGSGQFYLSQGDGKDSWQKPVFSFITVALANQIPLLGVCFGCQLLALALGAHIEQREEMKETGTFAVTQTNAGRADPLFQELPKNFMAQYGHKDTPVVLPPNLVVLASTERVAHTAFRVEGHKAWGVLFHPELNHDRMVARLNMFPDYAESPEKKQELIALFQDTKDAARLLRLFVGVC